MTLRKYSRSMLLAVIALVSGCSNLPQTSVTPVWQLAGKVAYSDTHNRQSASIQWHQYQAGFNIKLFGPLGQGAVTIEQQMGLTQVLHQRQKHSSTNPEQLLQQLTGLQLPLTSMPSWVLGEPHGRSEHSAAYNLEGRIAQLSQDGWRISYSQYMPDKPDTPAQKIVLTHNDIRIKLIVKQWQFHATP